MNGTAFIDKIISPLTIQDLSEEELENYRKPFAKAGDGKPVLQYINELPSLIKQAQGIMIAITHKTISSTLPKLMLYSCQVL